MKIDYFSLYLYTFKRQILAVTLFRTDAPYVTLPLTISYGGGRHRNHLIADNSIWVEALQKRAFNYIRRIRSKQCNCLNLSLKCVKIQ